MKRLALVLAWVAVLWTATIAAARTWTDVRGNTQFEAEFIDLQNGDVRLLQADGSLTSLPIERLSPADRQFVFGRLAGGDRPTGGLAVRAGGDGGRAGGMPATRRGAARDWHLADGRVLTGLRLDSLQVGGATTTIRLLSSTGDFHERPLADFAPLDEQYLRRILDAQRWIAAQQGGDRAATARRPADERAIAIEFTESAESRRWFIGVGVDSYHNNAVFTNLSYCGRDIAKLGEQFQELGFDRVVTIGAAQDDPQPSRANIQQQLDALLGVVDAKGNLVSPGLVGRNDRVIVAFSGHGSFIGGEGFLCPADADLARYQQTMISVSQLLDQLAAAEAELRVLFVDACRNELAAPRVGGLPREHNLRRLAETLQQQRQGIAVLSSCAVGETSLESPQLQHGLFTYFLLEGLRGAAEALAVEPNADQAEIRLMNLCGYVTDQVQKYAKEHHQLSQQPKLSAVEVPNAALASIDLTRRMIKTLTLDLREVRRGDIPRGWQADQGVSVQATKSGLGLTSLQGGAAELQIPHVLLQGDFFVEYEIYMGGWNSRFELSLRGRGNTQTLNVVSGHPGGNVSCRTRINGLNAVEMSPNFDQLKHTVRLEIKQGILDLRINGRTLQNVPLENDVSYGALVMTLTTPEFRWAGAHNTTLLGLRFGPLGRGPK